MWSLQQALEKYLKYILLVNRIPAANVGHDLDAGLLLVGSCLGSQFPAAKRKLLKHIAAYGEYRYLDVLNL